jgi:uncharacterized membrane protein
MPPGRPPATPAANTSARSPSRPAGVVIPSGAVVALFALLAQGLFVQTVLSDAALGGQFFSRSAWRGVVEMAGARIESDTVAPGGSPAAEFADVPYFAGLVIALAGCAAGLIAVTLRRTWMRSASPPPTLWNPVAWYGLCLPGVWECLRLVAAGCEFSTGFGLLTSVALFVPLVSWSVWLAWLWPFAPPHGSQSATDRLPRVVWVGMAIYCATFLVLTLRLWQNLWIPHGDTVMYEEHLWNLLHGKGFRSYLDNGRLFLGEHVQVIHLLLIPVYVVWPHHLLLEIVQSAALAATAIPAFHIARRHTGCVRAATLFALVPLAYPPLQFLDIAIDFKTFRPNAFEIPFLLFALDAYERGRVRSFGMWILLCLLCQEDIAPILAPLGVWMAVMAWWRRDSAPVGVRTERLWLVVGMALAVFATLYTVAVIKWVLPWFRGGGDVHFASYFSDLGGSSGEIVRNLFTRPGMILGRVLSPEAALFAAALLLPLGGLSLLAPCRFLVAVPLLLVLGLNQLSRSPVHHFHAPLVPVLLWSAAAGLGAAGGWPRLASELWRRLASGSRRPVQRSPEELERRKIPPEAIRPTGKSLPLRGNGSAPTVEAPAPSEAPPSETAMRLALYGLLVAVGSMACTGLTPWGIPFWDSGSRAHWRALYGPSDRGAAAERAVARIPLTARVASTDFIHPRFTHHERSYDYSDYRPVVPDDTDYIVVDTTHPYSTIQRFDQIKELVKRPEEWEAVEDTGQTVFLVVRRKGRGLR